MNGERGRPFFDPARGILRIDELVDHDADRWKERGTATALSPTFLVTSAHVLPDGKRTQGLDGWRVCLPGKEQALPVKRFEFHSLDPVDLALIKLKEPVPGMEPCPMVQGHEAVLLDDLRRLPLATTGFPLGLDADKSSGLRIQEGAACGLTTRDGRLREYLLTRGAREGQSGGPLLAFLNGKWVALGIVDLGGRKGMGSGAWSGDEVAALPGLPPALRDSFPALRDLLADDPVLRAWLESEVRRHECMPYLLRRGIQRADLERFFERRLVMREADGLSDQAADPGARERPADLKRMRPEPRALRELIEKGKATVVVGDPGMGKSTLLRNEAWQIARDGARAGSPPRWIPVFLRLPELATHLGPVRVDGDQLLLQALGATRVAAILRRNALRNRLVLLLDGLDEATVEGTAVKKLPKVLADIIQDFGAGAVVITTRPAGFVGDAGLRKELEVAAPGSFDVTTLEPLGDVEQVALVGKLVEAKCNSAPDLERIRLWLEEAFSDGQAQELRGNPLWLTLQALLFDPEKQAPGTLGELVERAIEALLRGEHNEQPEGQKTDRPPEHDVKRPPDAALPAVRALLAGVAERLTALGRESASFHELRALWSVLMDREPDGDEEKRAVRLFSQRLARHPLGKARPLTAGQSQMIATHLPDPFEFWRFVRLQTGVVVQPGAGFERSTEQNGTEEWRFWHRLFQEALAAESLAARWTTQKQEVLKTLEQALEKGTRRDRAERQGPSAWEETLVFLAGRLEHADDLAPLAKTLEDGQLSRFLAHARRLSRGRLLDLMKSAKEDERRGIVLEASPRLLKDRAEYETLRDRAQKAFEEFGAWCWFADEGLRRLEGREGWEWVKEARREWWRARAPENIEDLLTVQVGANRRRKTVTTWVDVPEGTFWMGSPEDDKGAVASEKPQHPVKMSTFRLWRTPVTLRQYRQFDPEHQDHWSKGARLPADEREDRPITDVSWWAAMAFSRWLGFWLSKCTSLEGTLPTEAQWEYACRGKSVGRAEEQTRFATGNDDSHLDECGWFTKNSDDRVHAVGRKRENGFDLFDTHGNVWEWCRDSWRTYVSSDEPIADPVGPTTGAGRAVRGGCCWVVARGCRSAYRNGFHVWDRDGDQGFRPVLPAAADCR